MAKEVERKFLVANDSWKDLVSESIDILQAYISHRVEGTVRLRLANNKAYLTLKGRTNGIERHEWEYEIPFKDGSEMIENKIYEGDYISKTRNFVRYENLNWEVDVFHGSLEGLILAEIELPDSDTPIELPPFIGEEVSGDPRYFNSNLLKHFGS